MTKSNVQAHVGLVIFLVSLGMMASLVGGDLKNLNSWSEALYPSFVGGIFIHFAAVVTAAVGGNLVPNLFKSWLTNETVEQKEEV